MAMNSIHRVGLTFATLAAVATLAGSLFMQGYVAAEQAAVQAATQASVKVPAQATASLAPEVVYVSAGSPAPVPPAQRVQPIQQPQIIHVVVPAFGDDGGSDG
jgi:hypothetical protein